MVTSLMDHARPGHLAKWGSRKPPVQYPSCGYVAWLDPALAKILYPNIPKTDIWTHEMSDTLRAREPSISFGLQTRPGMILRLS
jgi:hypothetical protein